jgi:hypothetical protein
LGHRWWIRPKVEQTSFYGALSFSDLVSLVEGLVSKQGVPEAIGLSVHQLVNDLLLTWQDRYFFGESPLLVSQSSGRLRDVSLRATREPECLSS